MSDALRRASRLLEVEHSEAAMRRRQRELERREGAMPLAKLTKVLIVRWHVPANSRTQINGQLAPPGEHVELCILDHAACQGERAFEMWSETPWMTGYFGPPTAPEAPMTPGAQYDIRRA